MATLAFGQIIRPGVFPLLPGGYLRLTSSQPTPTTVRGVVALVGRGSWGPIATPQLCYGVDDATRIFGASSTINNLLAQALAGGAQAAYCVRAGGLPAGTAPSLTLQDTTVAPHNSVILTGKNVGAIPLTMSYRQSPGIPGTWELVTYSGGLPLEVLNVGSVNTAGAVVAAVNDANKGSAFWTAALGVAPATAADIMATVTQVPPTVPGVDPTVTAAGMDAARQSLSNSAWFAMAEDSEDPVEHAALQGYIDQDILNGLRRMAVAGQDIATVTPQNAQPTVAAMNDPAMVYVTGDFTTKTGTVAGYQLAARVAGILSTMRPTHTLHGRAFPDATGIAHDLSRSDSAYAQQNGMVYPTRDHRGRIVTSRGVTTMTNPATPPLWAENTDEAWKMADRTARVFTVVDAVFQSLLDRIFDPNPDNRPLQNSVGLLDLLGTGQNVLNGYMPQAIDPISKLVQDVTAQAAAPAGTYSFKIDPFKDIGGIDTIILKLNTTQ